MRTLICVSPGQFEYATTEINTPKKGESLIRILKVGICGTDLHAFEGTQPYFSYPRILGHEIAAEFIEGDAEGFSRGDRVTVIPYFNCGHCIACNAGKPNCCERLEVCGVHRDGAMREFLLVPSASLLRGDGLSLDQLALVEPLAIGAHSLFRANVQPNENVLVVGTGPIGLGIIEIASLLKANVLAMDVNDTRLALCSRNFKVAHTFNALQNNLVEIIKDATGGNMPTLVIDATGNQKAINQGFKYMAHGGKYVLVGLQKNEVSFSHPEFHKREGTLMSSRNATRADFEFVVDALRSKRIDESKFLTHSLTFSQVKAEFSSLLQPENGVIKAMINMN
jgi:2-desacetyl-2-hydroxyethyl bacteriochlorophyllide A dehydrogenase